MFKSTRVSEKLSPEELLKTHADLSGRTQPILSVIVGSFGSARKVWGAYCCSAGLSPRVAPHSDPDRLLDVYRFASRSSAKIPGVGLLIVPEVGSAKLLADFLEFRKSYVRHQFALVVGDTFARDFFKQPSNPDLVAAVLSGLVLLNEDEPSSPKFQESAVLYRSPHEEILHKLLEENPAFRGQFQPNVHRRGASGLSYEIDLFSSAWSVAVEVDGIDHERNRAQKERDERRDEDFAKNGIKTLRIRASAIVSNPSNVLTLLSQKLLNDKTSSS
ncbi:MAG: DUF559 domain-containing protein [Verrucomicrobiales bacterium]|nr:DUF559 domain-containing protein [Verrucomicrobiales bacterium]